MQEDGDRVQIKVFRWAGNDIESDLDREDWAGGGGEKGVSISVKRQR